MTSSQHAADTRAAAAALDRQSRRECERYLLIETGDDDGFEIFTLMRDQFGFDWKVRS